MFRQVLSADAFSAFEEVLGDDAAVRDTGRRFRDTVLALGGGRAPDAVFRVRAEPCNAISKAAALLLRCIALEHEGQALGGAPHALERRIEGIKGCLRDMLRKSWRERSAGALQRSAPAPLLRPCREHQTGGPGI